MRIACIYFKTTSVGGIATHSNRLREAAIKCGDTFDILHTWPWKTKKPVRFANRQAVRGGDTSIVVDGEVSHHPDQMDETAAFLRHHYDGLLFIQPCPHPNKAYGDEPHFAGLYNAGVPATILIPDGYFDTYYEWGKWACTHPATRLVAVPNPSYGLPCHEFGLIPEVSRFPFIPKPVTEAKTVMPSMVWAAQWKNIKGINQFINQVERLPSDMSVDMYSNGIEYYKLRLQPVWDRAIARDMFNDTVGNGRAIFRGEVNADEIAKAFQRAWFTCNLQGMTSSRASYKTGAYNNTEVEALYYGVMPILHTSVTATILPRECYLTSDDGSDIPELVAANVDRVMDPARVKRAREFVNDTHDAVVAYQVFRKGWK